MTDTRWKHTFALIWSGQAASILTSSIFGNAIIWYLTYKTGSAAVLSMAAFMHFLPRSVLGPFIGSAIDRYDRKKIMIFSDLFVALVSLALVVAGSGGDLPVWVILLALGLRSIGSAFHEPSLQAVTPLIVPEEMLTRCAGYSSAIQSASLIAGPAIAAALYALWDVALFMVLDVAGALIAGLTLVFAGIPKLVVSSEAGQAPAHPLRRLLGETRQGLALLRDHPGISGLIFIGFLFSFLYVPVSSLFPLMTISYMNGTTAQAGLIEIVFAAGMLVGGLVLGVWGGTRNRIVTMAAAMMLMGLAQAVSGLLPPTGYLAFVFATLVLGFAAPFYSGPFMALIQQKIPGEYLGRVLGLSGSVMSFACPLGLIFSGLFAERVGVHTWFLMAGILTGLSAAFFVVLKHVRVVDSR